MPPETKPFAWSVLTAYTASSKLKRKKKKKNGTETILSYNDLEVGDFVVHEIHGIGQYMGIENLTVDGVSRDYISIQYAGSDKLCLPVEKLDLVSKYIGAHADDGLVKLSRFGGGEWKKDLNGKDAYVAVWGGPQQFLLVDANGISVEVLAKSPDLAEVSDADLAERIRDNPAGQDDELTPFILIRDIGDAEAEEFVPLVAIEKPSDH